MSYKIIGDSCLDCNDEIKKTGKIQLIPLTLEVGDLSVIDDETFDQQAFIKAVQESEECPRSACPSPDTFMKAYAGPEERVYCITLSKHLSGSFNSASLGKICIMRNTKEILNRLLYSAPILPAAVRRWWRKRSWNWKKPGCHSKRSALR